MLIRKEHFFWLIMVAVVLLMADLTAGLFCWLRISPVEMMSALPGSAGNTPHPYKSYMYTPGGRYWVAGGLSFTVGGRAYDYGLLGEGIVFDQFGHGVLPADAALWNEPKRPRERRILFLGGSTTFLPWPFFVADLLTRNTGLNVRAINAGTGGYTSQENIADLVTSGFAYEPDMIVAYLPINDIYHAARWPHFKRDYTHFRTAMSREIVKSNQTAPDQSNVWSWPFSVRLVQLLDFNRAMKEYISTIALNDVVTVKPGPDELKIWIDQESFKGTVAAVVENIRSMRALASDHGIPFVLITQKVFKTSEPFYTFIDPYVLESIERIKIAPELKGINLIEMQSIFPNSFDAQAAARVSRDFPGRKHDFEEAMAYDSMHFTPTALYLFASIVSERLAHHIH